MLWLDKLEIEFRRLARGRDRVGDLAAAISDLPWQRMRRLIYGHDGDARATLILSLKLMLCPKFSDDEIEHIVANARWAQTSSKLEDAMGQRGYGSISTNFPFPVWGESCGVFVGRLDAWLRSGVRDTLRRLFCGEVHAIRQRIENDWPSLSPSCASHREHRLAWTHVFTTFFPGLRTLQIIFLADLAMSARSKQADRALAERRACAGTETASCGVQTDAVPAKRTADVLMSQRSMARLAAANSTSPVASRDVERLVEDLRRQVKAVNTRMDRQTKENKMLRHAVEKLKNDRTIVAETNGRLACDYHVLQVEHEDVKKALDAANFQCKSLELQLQQARDEVQDHEEAMTAFQTAFDSLQTGLNSIGHKRPRYEKFDDLKVNLVECAFQNSIFWPCSTMPCCVPMLHAFASPVSCADTKRWHDEGGL